MGSRRSARHLAGLERFADMTHLRGILYLGLGASALCFVIWNLAVAGLFLSEYSGKESRKNE